MCRSRLWLLYWVRTAICSTPALTRFDRAKSISRYSPANGTAGLARSAVSGASRLPSPPASTSPITLGSAMSSLHILGAGFRRKRCSACCAGYRWCASPTPPSPFRGPVRGDGSGRTAEGTWCSRGSPSVRADRRRGGFARRCEVDVVFGFVDHLGPMVVVPMIFDPVVLLLTLRGGIRHGGSSVPGLPR